MADEVDKLGAEVAARTYPYTLKLTVPVKLGDEVIDELTFQRGQLKFLKGIPVDGTPSADQLMMIASRLCGQPLGVIERLDPDDSGEVIGMALLFFGRSLAIGGMR